MLALVSLALAVDPEPREAGAVAMGVAIAGGAAIAYDIVWFPHPKLALDLAVGPRFGVGEDLSVNIAGIAGVAYELGDGHVRFGPFVRVGATPPGVFTEAFAAGGGSLRFAPGKGHHLINLDLGGGYFFVRDIPTSTTYQGPELVYLRASWTVLLG